jgi:hypothetical protein
VGSVFGPIWFLLPVCRLCDFSTHWTYMLIFRHIFLSNYWWQKSDIWSQASYRYPISWEAFLDPSDSCFLFAKERGCLRWALAHSSSCICLKLLFLPSLDVFNIEMPFLIDLTFYHSSFNYIYMQTGSYTCIRYVIKCLDVWGKKYLKLYQIYFTKV